MDEQHNAQMAEMSRITRNQFFLHASDKIQMLEMLVQAESTFRMKYNKKSVEFVCGSEARLCSAAYRNWASAIEKNLQQLIEDGPSNKEGDMTTLGYNNKTIYKDFNTTKTQLRTYSQALTQAIGGAYAQKKKEANKTIAPDLLSEFLIDSVFKTQGDLIDKIDNDFLPYLFEYYERGTKFGDHAVGERRNGDQVALLKGFKQNHQTFLSSIVGLIWAKNDNLKVLHEVKKYCHTELDGASRAPCDCPRHTWLRGQTFSKHQFIAGWEESWCTVMNGYFTTNCEAIQAEGKDKKTLCPKNKYWIGVRKTGGKDEWGGLDEAEYKCCQLVHGNVMKGDTPLPDSFKNSEGKY